MGCQLTGVGAYDGGRTATSSTRSTEYRLSDPRSCVCLRRRPAPGALQPPTDDDPPGARGDARAPRYPPRRASSVFADTCPVYTVRAPKSRPNGDP